MKFQDLRRAGGLFFALFLALALTLALTAPGRADGAADGRTLGIYDSGGYTLPTSLQTNVGVTTKLTLKWSSEEGLPANVEYHWSGSGVAFDNAKSTAKEVQVIALETGEKTITVEAYSSNTFLGKAECKLNIAASTSEVSIAEQWGASISSLKIDGSANLVARCTPQPSFGMVWYEWTGNCFSFDPAIGESVRITAVEMPASGSTATVTVNAYWKPDRDSSDKTPLGTGTMQITINPKLGISGAKELTVGGKTQLTAAWYADSGKTRPATVSNVTYAWSCDPNKAVAFDNAAVQSPTVTALSTGTNGTVYVYVTATFSDGTTDTGTYELAVSNPDLELTSSAADNKMQVGSTATLTATVDPMPTASGTVAYKWTSSDKNIAAFDTGDTATTTANTTNITAVAGGKATITVIAQWTPTGSQTPIDLGRKTLEITVAEPGLKITGAPESNSLLIGQSATLKAEWDEGTQPQVTSGSIKYDWKFTTSNGAEIDEVVNITESGDDRTVAASKAITEDVTVTIDLTAKWSGGEKSITYKLRIVAPKVTIDQGSQLSLTIDGTETLKAQVTANTAPAGAGEPTYAWTVEPAEGEAAPVTVNPDNIAGPVTVTAVKSGKAAVKVTATWTLSGGLTVTAKQTITVTVSGPVLKVYDNDGQDITEDGILVLKEGSSAKLTVKLFNGPANGVDYSWTMTGAKENDEIEILRAGAEATITIKKKPEKEAFITVTAKWGDKSGTDYPAVTIKVTTPEPVTDVKLDKTELKLQLNDLATLTATVAPETAGNKKVIWTSSNKDVATVDDYGKVAAVGVGTATITAASEENPDIKATCEVTVEPATITKLVFSPSGSIIRSGSDPKTWDLTVGLLPEGAELGEDDKITWSVTVKEGSPEMENPLKLSGTSLTVSEDGMTATGTGAAALTVQLISGDPGVFTVTAKYNDGGTITASIDVTISGITLTKTKVTDLLVGGNAAIAIDKVYGFAANSLGTSDVEWNSSDPSVVSVVYGELTGWKLGKAVITAKKNGYTAQCEVEVKEDEDVIAEGYDATVGNPLKMSAVYARLNEISHKKTRTEDAHGNVTYSDLAYITNLTVSTGQGTLYYNYLSEANPGDGVGSTDRFAWEADGTIRSLSMLYFVPRQGFKGTAEISFIGWAKDGTSFAGVIKVEVIGAEDIISYRTKSGEPAYFLTDDFDAFSRSKTGRGVNYVTFSLPPISQGVLYYNYVAGEGLRVSGSTRFSRTGRYTIGDVCFVPNAAFVGNVTITFHGVDTAGQAFTGSVVVNVTPPDGDSSGVYLAGERGSPVVFQSSQLNAACMEAIHDTLSFVTFKLPTLEEGTLYYNYRGPGNFESRVNATTRYFFSGVPGINNVAFVPAPGATGRIAISYTGYGTTGATYEGKLYISLDELDTNIYYFAPKNGSVAFDRSDFNMVGLHRLGVNVDYVTFAVPSTGLGTLYYDYRSSNSYQSVGTYAYYITPRTGQRGLSLISFRAGNAVGTVTIPYTAYSGTGSSQKSFSGNVLIQVGTFTPADTNVSCANSGRVLLSGSELSRACRSAMTGSLSYIEITSVPDPEMGRLYLNYYGFGTGTVVNPGDRFYYSGSPNINQLSFVPRAGFTGEAEITYIGYSGDSLEQVSGRVMVDVTSTTVSRFSDMGGFAWAIDSVEFLRQSGTVQGYGDGRFNPEGIITRGDFALMLVRAYHLTASGGSSFYDVPAGSYYADAVRVAAALGIVQGYNGYFYPTTPLSRQDAMTMIFNYMKASGKTFSNGLAADFSAFHDEGSIASYAREALGSLIQMGIVKGNGSGYLLPLKQFNRAEAAVLMHTIMTL